MTKNPAFLLHSPVFLMAFATILTGEWPMAFAFLVACAFSGFVLWANPGGEREDRDLNKVKAEVEELRAELGKLRAKLFGKIAGG